MKLFFSMYFLIAAFIVTGCAGSKEARTIKNTVNGKWHLETIDIEGDNTILAVKTFNEASHNCFIGSSWNFTGNNGSGSYTLLEGKDGCSMLTRKIRWTIYEPEGEAKKFQFKRLDENNQPLDDNNGYRLSISSLTDSSMKLISAITYNEKPVNIIYNFIKK